MYGIVGKHHSPKLCVVSSVGRAPKPDGARALVRVAHQHVLAVVRDPSHLERVREVPVHRSRGRDRRVVVAATPDQHGTRVLVLEFIGELP